jgi:beta-ureidopropionase / N-carbamoyl-L-amino-acid hydrolase
MRRKFLGGLMALGAAGRVRAASAETAAASPPRVNAARLRARLEALSVFGRPPGGGFGDGVSRTAFSDADVAGRAYVIDEMRALGLEPRVDPAGNIRGAREGSGKGLAPILFGSHVDSVRGGGNFDGDVGSMGALEVVATLGENRIVTRHPLEVVVWAAEESSFGSGLHGSRMAAGQVEAGEWDRVENGVRKADALRRIGGDPDRIAEARRQPGSFHAYLELHVEQGGRLDHAGIPIGVVEGIVTIDDYDVSVVGFANHAGTTPMPDRKDALVAASRLVLAVREIATAEAGTQVGTVGRLEVSPGAPNVVPGRVEMTVEFRDLSADTVDRLGDALRRRAAEIAADTKTAIEIELTGRHEGARTNAAIQSAIERAAATHGLRTMRLPSGAGHDAQMMARLGPIGMIFVPSVGGVSHSPRELSRFEDCAQGADVLLGTILELDTLERIP